LPFVLAYAAFGQAESTNATAFSRLEMNIDARGGADVRARILERQMPGPITPVMQHLLGCAFDNPKDRDVDGDWIFAGRCGGAFRKRRLLVAGELQFTPLMEIL